MEYMPSSISFFSFLNENKLIIDSGPNFGKIISSKGSLVLDK